jgi:predicted transcriptional regulator
MWARASTAPRFIPARDAIVAALKEGPMNVPGLAQKTGKGTSTVKSALHRHLLPNGEVIRTKFGIYALPGTQPPYISKCDAIIAALKKGPMTVSTLARVTCTTPSSLYQFIDLLLANGRVIRTKRGTYALAGTAPVYVPIALPGNEGFVQAGTKLADRAGALGTTRDASATSAAAKQVRRAMLPSSPRSDGRKQVYADLRGRQLPDSIFMKMKAARRIRSLIPMAFAVLADAALARSYLFFGAKL